MRTPFWFFRGEADPVVPFEESQRLVKAIRELGGEAKWSLLPGVGHDCWTEAYGDEALYQWLFSKQLVESSL